MFSQRRRIPGSSRGMTCDVQAAGRAPARPRRRSPAAPGRSARRAWGRRRPRCAARHGVATSTRPAEPKSLQQGTPRLRARRPGPSSGGSSRAGRSIGVRSRSSIAPSRDDDVPRFPIRVRRLRTVASTSRRLARRPRRSARRGRSRAAGRTRIRPPRFFLSRPMASSSRSASSPGPRSAGRSDPAGRQCAPTTGPDPAEPLGQPALGDHADGDRLAVLIRARRSRRPTRWRGRPCGRSSARREGRSPRARPGRRRRP